jgi:enediyne biosynthesis protein E4
MDRVEITWPGGEKEELTNLPADRFYLVREGKGVIRSEGINPKAPKD